MSEDPDDRPDPRCERARLLLSLAADGLATDGRREELDAHVAACAGCRAAQAVDTAVARRLAEPADVPAGFAERTAARAARQRLEARAQNRLVALSGVAAVLAASVALVLLGPPRGHAAPRDHAPRDRAGAALSASLAGGRVAHMNITSTVPKRSR